MKYFKKIISVFVVTALLSAYAVVPAFAEFSDVADNASYATAVEVLSKLEIITGYPDGTFGPDREVTRAEFTAMLMRTMGYGNIDVVPATLPFDDISAPDVSGAIPNIVMAADLGIVNGMGDRLFAPSQNVKYEQAIKMIVCALGYGGIVEIIEGADWYKPFLDQAIKIGVTKGTAVAPETDATRATIAQLIHSSLEIDKMEPAKAGSYEIKKDKTLLTDNLKLTKVIGKVVSVGKTSILDEVSNLKDNEVKITTLEEPNGVVYTTEDVGVTSKLGHDVEIYYRHDINANVRTIVLYNDTVSGEEIVIQLCDIDVPTSTNKAIKYREPSETRTSTLTIDDSFSVVLNDQKVDAGSFDLGTAISGKEGTLKAISSHSGSSYNQLIIDAYDVYVVSTTNVTESIIVDNVLLSSSRSVTLDVTDHTTQTKIVDVKNAEMAFSSIKKWDVVYVKETPGTADKKKTAVVVRNTMFSASPSETNPESAVINGKEYFYSGISPWMNGRASAMPAPNVGETYNLYLDMNDKILVYEKTAGSEGSLEYAYIMKMQEGDSRTDPQIYVLRQNGQKQIYTFAKNVKWSSDADATTVTKEEIIAKLKAEVATQNPKGYADSESMLVKMTIGVQSGQQVVTRVVIPYKFDKVASDYPTLSVDKVVLNPDVIQEELKYKPSSQLVDISTGKLMVNTSSATTVFVVPNNKSVDDYRKTTATSAFNNENITYTVTAFDYSQTNRADVVVAYDVDGKIGGKEIDYTTPIYIIERVSQVNNSDSQPTTKFEGKQISSSGTVNNNKEMFVAVESLAAVQGLGLTKGDIVRFATNSKGEVTEAEFVRHVAADNTADSASPYYMGGFIEVDGTASKSDEEKEYRVINGYVNAIDLRDLSVDGMDIKCGASGITNLDGTVLSSATFLKYTFNANGVPDITASDKSSMDGYTSALDFNGDETKATKLFVFMSGGKARLVIEIIPPKSTD